jgi:hypothetical protein
MRFALLYRNLMAACQIWCEEKDRSSTRHQARLPGQTCSMRMTAREGTRSLVDWHGSCVPVL